ncbi:MAG: hypothetical protein ACQEQO_12660 [Thermodesulfobacteriota bacterium]
MKCPKCGFITFDYFDTCPRCGKDMTREKTKLNISPIKPNPPFMLGSLIGNLSDNPSDMEASEQTKGESQNIEMNSGEVYDDGLDLDIAIDEKTPETENIGQGANLEEGWKDKGVYKKESENKMDELDLESEDLDLNLEIDDDEDTKI